MSNSNDLRARASKIETEARVILESMDGADEARAADLHTQFNKAIAEAEALEDRAAKLDALDAREAARNAVETSRRPSSEDRSVEGVHAGESAAEIEARSYESFIRRGEFRAQSVGTAANGGYLVPTSMADDIVKAMKYYGGALQVADVFITSDGGTWNQPTFDNTAYKATRIAENTAVDDTKTLTFGNKVMGAYTYTANGIRASNESLQDAKFDLNQLVFDAMAEAFGRGMNDDLTNATGSSQPEGVAYAIANGSGTTLDTGSAHVIGPDDLFALQHALNYAYDPNATWMLSSASLLTIRTMKDGENRYIWQPGLTTSAPGTILGKPYVRNDDMPAIADGGVPILYGDFKKAFKVRLVQGFSVQRLAERYAEYNQVGFIGHARMDSKVVDPKALRGLHVKAS